VYRFQEEIKLFNMYFQGRLKYESDTFGVLDKLKASFPDQNSSTVNFYDIIKCFEMEMKF